MLYHITSLAQVHPPAR